MKIYWNYFRFLSQLTIRKWSIYITTTLYLVVFCVVMYLLPSATGMDYQLLYSIKVIIGLIVLFGAVTSTNFGLVILKCDMNRSEGLQIFSRPFCRSYIFLTKLCCIFVYIICISIITLLLSLFVIDSDYALNNMVSVLIPGGFLGTFVVFSLFASLALIFGLVFNKYFAFSLIAIFEGILTLLNIIFLIVVKTEIEIKDKYGLRISPISLVSHNKNDLGNQKTNDGVIVLTRLKTPLTLDYRINGYTLKEWGFNDVNKAADYVYDLVKNDTNKTILGTFNLNAQLSNFYSPYTQDYVNHMNPIYYINYLMWETNFSNNWTLEIQETPNFQALNKTNNLERISIPNYTELYMIANPYFYIQNTKRQKTGIQNPEFDLDHYLLKFPTLTNLLTLKLQTKSFDNLSEFGKYYFKSQEISIKKWKNNYNQIDWERNDLDYNTSWIFTGFLNYASNNQNFNDLSTKQRLNVLRDFYGLVTKFQITTYKLLQEIVTNYESDDYSWVNIKTFKKILNVFAFDPLMNSINPKHLITIFTGNLSTLQNWMDSDFNKETTRQLFEDMSFPISFITPDYLQTFNNAKMSSLYNFTALIIVRLFFIFLLFSTSWLIFVNKDFR